METKYVTLVITACNRKIDRDLSELVQKKLLKWFLSVNKYCIDNACRVLTGSQ